MKEIRFRASDGYTRIGKLIDDSIEYCGKSFDPSKVQILPPTEPTKIICLAANYIEHLKESPRREVPDDIPDRPEFFLKSPNTITGHQSTVKLPTPGTEHDQWSGKNEYRIEHEAELAVIIGQQCRNISEDNVGEYIRGYTCMNDISNRNDQMVEQNWVRGKAFDGAAPIGPVIAAPDNVSDNPQIKLRVNGKLRQNSKGDNFIFSIQEAISEISNYMTLEPGDIVAMGTTHGVNKLCDGDTVEIEIEGVGTLCHNIEK